MVWACSVREMKAMPLPSHAYLLSTGVTQQRCSLLLWIEDSCDPTNRSCMRLAGIRTAASENHGSRVIYSVRQTCTRPDRGERESCQPWQPCSSRCLGYLVTRLAILLVSISPLRRAFHNRDAAGRCQPASQALQCKRRESWWVAACG